MIADTKFPGNVRVNLRGMVQGMQESFKSFAVGFILPSVLLYLILVAQFRSFVDPFLIMLAIPMGFIGVLVILPLTHTTLNVMSLMGVLMLIGIAGLQQHPDRGFRAQAGRTGPVGEDAVDYRVPRPAAADPDDFAGHDYRHDSDGHEAGHRRRAVYADGARDYRRPDLVGASHGVHRSGSLPARLSQ